MQKAKRGRPKRTAKPVNEAAGQPAVGLAIRRRRGRPRRRKAAGVTLDGASLAEAQQALGSIKSQAGVDLTEKARELLRLAREQGHLTYEDVNDALPDDLVTPEDLDQVHTKLRNLEIEIIDPAEVDRGGRAAESGEDEERVRYDILDDPVRMYLRQMGKVPLLNREQEVEICKRIEEAEKETRLIIYGLGFTGKEHIALAEKLLTMPPKER